MMNQLDAKKVVKALNERIDQLKSTGKEEAAEELTNLAGVIATGTYNIQLWVD